MLELAGGLVACDALLLDMDGVLVDSMELINRQMREWAVSHRLNADRVIAASHGRPNIDIVREVAPWLDARREVERLAEREIEDTHGLRGCDGALALTLKLPAWSWGIVTSAEPRVAHVRLRATGFPQPAILVTAADVRRGKPDPEGYLLAAASMGVRPQNCLVVEDAPAGVAAARAAGCRVAGVARTSDAVPCDVDYAMAGLTEMRFIEVATRGSGDGAFDRRV